MTYIFFDVDGVLINGYHAKPELRHCWDKHIERDFGVKQQDFFEQFISGVFVKEVLIGKADLLETLSEVLPRIGYRGDAQDFVDYWLQNDARLNQDLLAQIAKLSTRPDVDLYIATNQEHNRAHYLMENLGLKQYFNDIYHSARIGHIKPAPAYFAAIAADVGMDAERDIIFFDDTQKVVDAANDFGWQAHQFDSVKDLAKAPQLAQLLKLQIKNATDAIRGVF